VIGAHALEPRESPAGVDAVLQRGAMADQMQPLARQLALARGCSGQSVAMTGVHDVLAE
jgi:hypothetical protein